MTPRFAHAEILAAMSMIDLVRATYDSSALDAAYDSLEEAAEELLELVPEDEQS